MIKPSVSKPLVFVCLLSLAFSARGQSDEVNPTIKTEVTRIAVRDLTTEGVEERLGKVVFQSLLKELRKYQGLSLISMDEIRELMNAEADRQLAGCCESGCLAEIADALGADEVILGSLTTLGEETLFELKRVSQSQAKVLSSEQTRLKNVSGDALLAAIGPLVQKLLHDRKLKAGRQIGVDKAVALTLNPPPIQPLYTLSAAGLGASALVVSGALFAVNNALFTQFQNDAKASVNGPPLQNSGERIERINQTAYGAYVTAGVGGAMLLTASVMALFTDWWGYKNVSE